MRGGGGGGAQKNLNNTKYTEPVDISELTSVARFGKPIYPTLEHLGTVERGDSAAPHHMVIESENYHALQLLLHLYAGQVDCIYIDPPYNSGATDWKYNNDYVDKEDGYRHSKWLSMMEKRIILAKKLLRSSSVLVIAIDENEVNRLSLLIEQIFQEASFQMVTAVTSTGVSRDYFTRVDEYLLFCFFGDAGVCEVADDFLTDRSSYNPWDGLLRGGTNSDPSDRPNLVYPIGIDPQTSRIVGTGMSLGERIEKSMVPFNRSDLNSINAWQPPIDETVDGFPVVWPRRRNNQLGNWRVSADTLVKELLRLGHVRANHHENRNTWTITYLGRKPRDAIKTGKLKVSGRAIDGSVIIGDTSGMGTKPKTVWNRTEHNAGISGAVMLTKILGGKRFNFPKSLYAVRDTLLPIVRDNPNALIVDFFAGSGTTLHATLLLNEADGGRRRCILVTNNEIGPENEKRLSKQGIGPESLEWQRLGIFESVTRPRVEAAIRGERADGTKLDGKYTYAEDKPMADGFESSADFFRLRHLNPDEVISERSFDELHPLLWAASGGFGSCPTVRVGSTERHDPGYLMPGSGVISADCHYAVLLRESRFSPFAHELKDHPQVTHVWLQARNEDSLAEMRADLPGSLNISWLYRDWCQYFDREQGLDGR